MSTFIVIAAIIAALISFIFLVITKVLWLAFMASAVLWLLNLGVEGNTVFWLFVGAMACTLIVALASAGVEFIKELDS